eukprot:Gb_24379 [translate_table: standard]
MGENMTFTPTQILGMILSHMKLTTAKSLEVAESDCVIEIPSYFTEVQRRAYSDATSIAKLKLLRLMHESTAIALAYGIYSPDFSYIDLNHMLFVDIGNSDTQRIRAKLKLQQILRASTRLCTAYKKLKKVLSGNADRGSTEH